MGYEQQPRVLHGDRERRERCGEQERRPAERGGANDDPGGAGEQEEAGGIEGGEVPRKITASDTEKSAAAHSAMRSLNKRRVRE